MKNIKIELAPPYKTDDTTYKSKITCSIEFDDANAALLFHSKLNDLIIRCNITSEAIKNA